MKLAIKTHSETPIYEQLFDQIVANIVSNEVTAHQCLPSIRTVARELEISVVPVKAAYELLEQKGYVYTVPGKGCFAMPLQTDAKKLDIAKEKLSETLVFCKKMGLDCEKIVELVKQCYQEL